MATTSIWAVRGWLGKLVIYVENPYKTENPGFMEKQEMTQSDLQALSDVIDYAVNSEKTRRKEQYSGAGSDQNDELPDKTLSHETLSDEVLLNESMPDEAAENVMQQYVSGINCTPMTARMEMAAVKKRYDKDGGVVAYHGYQSFAPGECTPAIAHTIGLKLAEQLWGKRFQVIVATHLDKAHHLHNHFVVNSVSFLDGKRYHRTKQDYRDMRKTSDDLCRAYGLSVIKKPQHKGKQYGEWKAECEQKPTYRSTVRADIDDAIAHARTEKQFFYLLKEKGYSVKVGKDITVCSQGRDRGLKLARNFGEDYTIKAIRSRILTQPAKSGNTDSLGIVQRKVYTVNIHIRPTKKRRVGGLRGLYLHYCYRLGILPKQRTNVSTKQMHILLREDLRKLDTISKETRLLCHYHIDDAGQLFALQDSFKAEIKQLTDRRRRLYSKSRSIKDADSLADMKKEISALTDRIRKLRKEVMLCDGIAVRSGVIKEKLKIVRQEEIKGKERFGHEHIR